ncbi:protrudin isoform X4 [Engraulis encrasicolus]|uniref:protrudin isoform X4 n=1 Tax=Engraulis encrasicolus TaxID=184585 RepID=UPI002FD64CBC
MSSTVSGGAPDSPHGHGERGEAAHQFPSKELTTSTDGSELGCPRPITFDLLNMVISYKRIAIYLEPMKDCVEMGRYLLGWKMPVFSLLCCVMLNVLFLSLSEAAWFSLCLLGVSTPAALGYIGDRCQLATSDTERQRKRHHAVQRRDLQTVHLTKQEAMLEVKGLLKKLEEMLNQACVSAEAVYKVLYWESHSVSSMFYGGLMLVVCLLYVAPVGWVLALVNSALFLWNREFRRVLLDLKTLLSPGQDLSAEKEGEMRDAEHTSLTEQTPTPTSLEVRQLHSDDDDVPLGHQDFDAISDNGLLSRNEPIRSKVSKLTEKLRKRYPTHPAGNCSYCSAVFSVLKKRKSCSNCGNILCSRCCSYKVLKSSMGATAPEAQRETVFVCAACNMALSKKE